MYKDYKLLGIDLATGGDYTSFGDTIVQNKPSIVFIIELVVINIGLLKKLIGG